MFVKKQRDNARRIPRQERARQRLERILDAAADVFAEVGVEAATMEGIAEKAETSIGSLYQFFPNKVAIFDEIARRYHLKLKDFFDAIVDSPLLDHQPIEAILDASIEAVWSFHESEPAFRAVWVGLGFTQEVLSAGEALNKEFARRIESILAKKLAGLPPKKRPVVATVLVEVLTAMLIVSARRHGARGQATAEGKPLKEETKTLLRRYLEPYAVRSK